jgi:hypothetical protein
MLLHLAEDRFSMECFATGLKDPYLRREMWGTRRTRLRNSRIIVWNRTVLRVAIAIFFG